MKQKSIVIKNWVICSNCGAKLCAKTETSTASDLEIKCHQCKTINTINIEKQA